MDSHFTILARQNNIERAIHFRIYLIFSKYYDRHKLMIDEIERDCSDPVIN